MAITETYVDPAINGASGAGTVGDPYGDLQHALDTMTQDAVNGDRINIKAGTDEVLAAALDLTTYGTPVVTARLVLQGYTTAAGDGGIGGISGAGSYGMFASNAVDYVSLYDLHMHNSGAANIVDLDNEILIYNCEINNSSNYGISFDAGYVVGCHVHDVGTLAIFTDNGFVYGCSVEYGGSYTPTYGIYANAQSKFVNNTVKCTGAMIGIYLRSRSSATNNSVWSNGGTGKGIGAVDANTTVINNVVEGFSGAGGVGIEVSGTKQVETLLLSNAVYNCTTNYTKGLALIDVNNDTLSGSGFTDAANGDFSMNGIVAGMTEDAFPVGTFPEGSTANAADKGAAQAGAGAGGGGGRRARIRAHGV